MRKFNADNAQSLVAYLASCKLHNKPTPVLFLGAGASLSSGCPSTSSLLAHISERLGRKLTDLNELGHALNDQHLQLEIATDVLGKMPGAGYRFLTQLIVRGYFKAILTTNWDFLLEQEIRRHLPPEGINVYSRPLIADQILSESIKHSSTPFLIRLHGDLTTKPVVSPAELLALDEPLERDLKAMIAERGIIFIGYSMQEIRISSLVTPKTNSWYVEPFNVPLNNLQQLNIPTKNIITGDDALFDNFFESLCSSLLTTELRDRLMFDNAGKFYEHTEKIDNLIEKIKAGMLVDTIQDITIETEIVNLISKSQSLIGKDRHRSCLIFIDDRSAPGGSAIFDLILRSSTLKKAIKDHPVAIAKVVGRVGSRALDRSIVELRNFNDFDWKEIDTVIILDTVSFTASTLELTQKYVQSNYGIGAERCIMAILRLDVQARSKLTTIGVRIVSNELINNNRLVSPWGVTRPTSPSDMPQLSELSYNKKLAPELFLPANNFWYIPKPWGELTVFANNSTISTRILYFDRFQRTSLHYHLLRDEVFVGLDDGFIMQLWDKQIILNKNQAIKVPMGVPHRLIAFDTPFRTLEIAFGQYEDQKDIFRLDDIYDRKCEWESDGLE